MEVICELCSEMKQKQIIIFFHIVKNKANRQAVYNFVRVKMIPSVPPPPKLFIMKKSSRHWLFCCTFQILILRHLHQYNIDVFFNNYVCFFSFTFQGEDWQSARKAGESSMHILRPISINIIFKKCMFDNQVQLAK